MEDLKTKSIWSARIGFVFAILTQLNGSFGPVENTFAAITATCLFFAATFVPEKHYAIIKYYACQTASNVAAGLFLLFISYASATTAVLISDRALPSLASLFSISRLEFVLGVIVVIVSAIIPWLQARIEAFLSRRRPQPVAGAHVDEVDPPAKDPPVNANDPPVTANVRPVNTRSRKA